MNLESVHASLPRSAASSIAAASGFRNPSRSKERPIDYPLLLTSSNSRLTAIVCVPGAGDSVTSFADFARSFRIERNIYGLVPRGLDGESPPDDSVEAAAASNIETLRRAGIDQHIHLIGHSHGGLVVFEMARRLSDAARAALSLTMIDVEAPDRDPACLKEVPDSDNFQVFANSIELRFQKKLTLAPAVLEGGIIDDFLTALHAQIVQAGIVPIQSKPGMLRGPFATFSAARRCVYHPPSLYEGRCRLVIVPDPTLGMEADRIRRAAKVAAWRQFAPRLEVTSGPGNHFTILSRPNAEWLVQWWSQIE